MVIFQAFEKDMQVNGQTINSVSEAVSSFNYIADKYFVDAGLPKTADIKLEGWYSQQAWLNAFKSISEKVGSSTMFRIGKMIPENAQFPPEIDNIEKGLASIDVAYHMNHKNASGQVLFDKGKMYEGIGHYYFTKHNGNKATIKCENPYHCDFDKGIVTTMALKFELSAKIIHDDSKGCRKKGDPACYFDVEW